MSSTSPAIPSTTVKELMVNTLREAILSGNLSPGDRINESQLARQYHVSRIPVREALQLLHQQGLLMNHPRRGMFVNKLSEEDSQKISSLRIILEAEALKLCRTRMTPDCEHKLQSLVERMEKWQVGSEIDTATLDLDFHRTIWNQSGNSYLENALLTLVPFQFAHHALKIISHDAPRWPLAHHRVLFDVVLGKSKVTPEEAMLAHLKLSYPTPERFSSLAL